MILLTRWLFHTFGLLVIAEFVPGITISGFYAALIAALILGLLNGIIRPVLFVLTFPITVLTLGLFAFVINATLFWFAASFIKGFSVENFWYALFGSLLMSLVSLLGNRWIK